MSWLGTIKDCLVTVQSKVIHQNLGNCTNISIIVSQICKATMEYRIWEEMPPDT